MNEYLIQHSPEIYSSVGFIFGILCAGVIELGSLILDAIKGRKDRS